MAFGNGDAVKDSLPENQLDLRLSVCVVDNQNQPVFIAHIPGNPVNLGAGLFVNDNGHVTPLPIHFYSNHHVIEHTNSAYG